MDVSSFCSLPIAIVSWRCPEPALTIIVKATFDLRQDGEAPLAFAQRPFTHDRPNSHGEPGELETASDFAPVKARADVLVTGWAHGASPNTVLPVRFVIGSLERRVFAVSSQPATRLPLVGKYLRTNRQGTGSPVRIGPRPFDSVGNGVKTEGLVAARWNAAPTAQQLDLLSSNATIILKGLIPGGGRRELKLPGLRPKVYYLANPGSDPPLDVRLTCDTLWINGDEQVCTLTWRGVVILKQTQGRAEPLIVLALRKRGKKTRWPALTAALDQAQWFRAVEQNDPQLYPQPIAARSIRLAARATAPPKGLARDTAGQQSQPTSDGETGPGPIAHQSTAVLRYGERLTQHSPVTEVTSADDDELALNRSHDTVPTKHPLPFDTKSDVGAKPTPITAIEDEQSLQEFAGDTGVLDSSAVFPEKPLPFDGDEQPLADDGIPPTVAWDESQLAPAERQVQTDVLDPAQLFKKSAKLPFDSATAETPPPPATPSVRAEAERLAGQTARPEQLTQMLAGKKTGEKRAVPWSEPAESSTGVHDREALLPPEEGQTPPAARRDESNGDRLATALDESKNGSAVPNAQTAVLDGAQLLPKSAKLPFKADVNSPAPPPAAVERSHGSSLSGDTAVMVLDMCELLRQRESLPFGRTANRQTSGAHRPPTLKALSSSAYPTVVTDLWKRPAERVEVFEQHGIDEYRWLLEQRQINDVIEREATQGQASTGLALLAMLRLAAVQKMG